MATSPFPRLFGPARLGPMELRNRIVMPPMGTFYAAEDGSVTQQNIDYYEARAKGGAGLIIVEVTCVDAPVGQIFPRQLAIDASRFVPGLRDLAQAIQKHGARAAVQLHHGGREARSSITGLQPVAPSPMASPGGDVPREMTLAEIRALVASFASAARRAREAGFDGVEIHGAHGYLLSQFLSAASNKRSDAYGGTVENRARLLLEVIQAIRQAVGPSYPVWCRLSAREYGVEGGITIEETQQVARMAQEVGADAIHVSAHGTSTRRLPPMAQPPGNLLRLAEAIKRVVTVPVIAVGRLNPELGEKAVAEGRADFIAIGRALIADPELPNKAATGKLDEVRPCIACDCCRDNIRRIQGEGLRCAVNPAAGRERQYGLKPAEQSKRVVVVGGGPAGMETARVAALRGHRVTLYEQENELGGQLLAAARPPYKSGLENLTRYLSLQMSRRHIEVKLGMKATPGLIEQARPEAVIIATGATPLRPDIPGAERARVVTAVDVLTGKVEVGERVAIIGGELVGCETAEALADQGKKVTILRRGPEMAARVSPAVRQLLLERLAAKGVVMLTGVRYQQFAERGVLIIREGKEQTVEADMVVLAAGARPNTELYAALQDKVAEIHLVGDSVEPRRIMEALDDGYRIAMSL